MRFDFLRVLHFYAFFIFVCEKLPRDPTTPSPPPLETRRRHSDWRVISWLLLRGFAGQYAAYNATRSQRPLRRHRHEVARGEVGEGTKAPRLRFIFRLSRARISPWRELLAGPLNSACTPSAPSKDISSGTTSAAESSFWCAGGGGSRRRDDILLLIDVPIDIVPSYPPKSNLWCLKCGPRQRVKLDPHGAAFLTNFHVKCNSSSREFESSEYLIDRNTT